MLIGQQIHHLSSPSYGFFGNSKFGNRPLNFRRQPNGHNRTQAEFLADYHKTAQKYD